jgi:pseudaminic acid cytidylyltransferase
MTTVAIIPARGGSERIPRKNIKYFLGKPMIGYPISVLKETGLFDRIIVSTEDQEIADVAIEMGAEIPFMRPMELADNHTGTGEVMAHAVDWLIEHGQRPDYVCCVYATTPFLSSRYLEEGWEAVRSGNRIAFAVTSFSYPIQRCIKILGGGGVEPFFPEFIPYRSQDLEPAYHDAGQFYWWDTDAISEGISVFSAAAIPIVLPRHLVQDIDDEEDWQRAELMYRAMQLAGPRL